MPCSSCNENSITILGWSQISSQNGNCGCTDCDPTNVANSSCVFYSGPNLNCLGVETCDDLNTVLSKIDEKLCTVIGDYSLYNKYCLDDLSTINTEQQFVEAVAQQFCTLKSTVDTFLTTSFPAYQTTVDSRFDAIEVPGITCSAASVLNTDSLNSILTKYCTQISSIKSNLDLTGVDWDQCFVVGTNPVTLSQAFDVIIDQICLVKGIAQSGSSSLPTFNNVGSCLPAPVTSTDSLVDTVNKIKSKLCTLPTFDSGSVSWGCIAPAATFQDSLQNVISKLSDLSQSSIVQVSSDFTLTPVNPSDLCQGWQLNFAGSIVDRKFALNSGDSAPDYFLNKVVAGAGVVFDTVTIPGKVVVKSDGSSVDEKVKSFIGDPVSGYLSDKLEGNIDVAAGLTINVALNPTTNKVQVTPVLDMAQFLESQFSFIQSNESLRAAFCELVSGCTTNPPVNPTPSGVLYVSSTLSGMQISVVNPNTAYSITSGAFPINAGQSLSGTVNGTVAPISVTLTGSPVVGGNLTLYKNGVPVQCINITTAGTYFFMAVNFAPTDNITISLSTGSCT